jgi:hypothetical protein
MSLSKKELKDIKDKLSKTNPNFKNSLNKKKVTYSKSYEKKSARKSVVKWNFKVNEIVMITFDNSIGLIVSDHIFQNRKVEQNSFFVFTNSVVKNIDGRFLRKI